MRRSGTGSAASLVSAPQHPGGHIFREARAFLAVSGDADRRLLSAAGAWLHVRTRDGCRSGLSPRTKSATDCRTDEARGEYIRLGEPSSLGASLQIAPQSYGGL